MFIIEFFNEEGVWERLDEGPWDTEEEAQEFAYYEVGADWRVVEEYPTDEGRSYGPRR